MSATPVGYLYTPQQLMGSVKYGSGVLLGNWREDDALNEMRMMDHVSSRESGNLTVIKQKEKFGPQLAPAELSKTPTDGLMRSGDVVMLKSIRNGGAVAVSLGQPFEAQGDVSSAREYSVFATDSSKPVARNAIKIVSFDGVADGSPICYGQKVALCFSDSLPVAGLLASCPSGRSGLQTTVVSKQEVYMSLIDPVQETVSYDCAWALQPVDMDERLPAQGRPVAATEPFVLVHCGTNRKLAGVQVMLPTDFGTEYAICCHTFTLMGKVNKLMRETRGKPSADILSRAEETENFFSAVYA